MAALQAGQAELARYRFAQLLRHQPQHAAAHHFHGAALALLGDLPAAKEAMRRSVQLHPYQPSWLANLAAIEQTLGDRQAADAWRAQRQQLLESRLEASAR
jgi:Flp pilus assembly protein TadD